MVKRRHWTFRWMIALALIGLIDSVYLIWIKIANDKIYCLPGIGDCWTVNTSSYSEILGIPVSVIGVFAYLTILLMVIFESRSNFLSTNGPILLFGLTLAGFLFSLYLTYIEIFVIFAICPFCVVSALAMTALWIVSIIRLVHHQATI